MQPVTRPDVGDLVSAALAVCGLGGDLHVAPRIPAAKLDKATRACRVPAGETVLALVDFTIFGSASDALVIGAHGLDYHHDSGDPKDYTLAWADTVAMAYQGGMFTVVDKTHLRTPDGVSLYTPCSVGTDDLVVLLSGIHQRVVDDAVAAAVPVEPAAPPDASPVVMSGPVVVAPDGAQAQDQDVWRHLLADMRADLDDSVSRMLYGPDAADLQVYAIAGDARADLLCAFVGDSGDLLVAVWGNKELPQALSLAHQARRRLTDELGFQVLTGQGLAFARGFGPAAEADVADVVAVLTDLIFSVFDLPRGSLAVSWDLVRR